MNQTISIYRGGFSLADRNACLRLIADTVFRGMQMLLDRTNRLEHKLLRVSQLEDESREFKEQKLTAESIALLVALWQDPAIQFTFATADRSMNLPDNFEYFMNQIAMHQVRFVL